MLPNGIITLTTDFGLDDPYVGIMKGVILGRCPAARIIDLSHHVPAYRPEIAGLWLGLACRWFPAGSVHLAVVDPGVGTDRAIVLLVADEHWFLAPDNGLAAEIERHVTIRSRRRVDLTRPATSRVSATFHGRDIFAPLAASLAADDVRPEDVGPLASGLTPSALPVSRRVEDRVQGQILFADRFGNLVTNIPATILDGRTIDAVRCAGRSFPLVRTYGDAPAGTAIALINSSGLLELACPRGDATQSLGLAAGATVTVEISG